MQERIIILNTILAVSQYHPSQANIFRIILIFKLFQNYTALRLSLAFTSSLAMVTIHFPPCGEEGGGS